MKVLYITDPGIVGGATRSLVDVVSSMKKKGVECIVCTSSYSDLNQELDAIGIANFASYHRSVMDIPAYKKWKKPFKKIIKMIDYYISIPLVMKKIEDEVDIKTLDLIHTNSARNDIGCVLAKKYKIIHIMHIREFGQEDFKCICYRRSYEQYINKYTTSIIAISNAVKEAWIKKGIDGTKVRVVYNGVDSSSIESSSKIAMLDNSRLSMVIVGGVCEAKGQLQVIEAMGRLPESIRNNIYLDIIGWGDIQYMSVIKKRSKELCIERQVKIQGACNMIYKLLKNYQVGLMCSKSEGFGRVTAEYMHACLGVIASDTGANTELICNERTGLIYHLGNYDELASKIELFYKNRELLYSCASKAQHYARENFTKELNAQNVYNEYIRLVSEKNEGQIAGK